MFTRLLLLSAVGFLVTGCPRPCTASLECDDGIFCNGPETCVEQKCAPGVEPSCTDGIACTIDLCSEGVRSCVHNVPDVDGDGSADVRCLDQGGVPLGDDCDDRDANTFPGRTDDCNTPNDDDCNPATLGGVDDDGDGYESAACSNPQRDGGVKRGTDCDDDVASVHPGQAELCNTIDDDCDGTADEGVTSLRYRDDDNDGWGSGAGTMGCVLPLTSPLGTDCDDLNPAMHPGQFSCMAGGQGNVYSLCNTDGGRTTGLCPAQGMCRPQPNGTGICF